MWGHEIQFAREVALATIIENGRPLWQTMIPGMFIVDFLKRLKYIRQVSVRYHTVRILALDQIGHPIGSGTAFSSQTLKNRIQKKLAAQNAKVSDAQALTKILDQMIRALGGHYQRMLDTQGRTWGEMITTAYTGLNDYRGQLLEIEKLEADLHKVITCPRPQRQYLPLWTELEAKEIHSRHLKNARMFFDADDNDF